MGMGHGSIAHPAALGDEDDEDDVDAVERGGPINEVAPLLLSLDFGILEMIRSGDEGADGGNGMLAGSAFSDPDIADTFFPRVTTDAIHISPESYILDKYHDVHFDFGFDFAGFCTPLTILKVFISSASGGIPAPFSFSRKELKRVG
jgi:hypothetical protein